MPDIPSARFGGTGPSVSSDIYIGSMITSGSPYVASDHFGGLTGDDSGSGFAAPPPDDIPQKTSDAVLVGHGTLHNPICG